MKHFMFSPWKGRKGSSLLSLLFPADHGYLRKYKFYLSKNFKSSERITVHIYVLVHTHTHIYGEKERLTNTKNTLIIYLFWGVLHTELCY